MSDTSGMRFVGSHTTVEEYKEGLRDASEERESRDPSEFAKEILELEEKSADLFWGSGVEYNIVLSIREKKGMRTVVTGRVGMLTAQASLHRLQEFMKVLVKRAAEVAGHAKSQTGMGG